MADKNNVKEAVANIEPFDPTRKKKKKKKNDNEDLADGSEKPGKNWKISWEREMEQEWFNLFVHIPSLTIRMRCSLTNCLALSGKIILNW